MIKTEIVQEFRGKIGHLTIADKPIYTTLDYLLNDTLKTTEHITSEFIEDLYFVLEKAYMYDTLSDIEKSLSKQLYGKTIDEIKHLNEFSDEQNEKLRTGDYIKSSYLTLNEISTFKGEIRIKEINNREVVITLDDQLIYNTLEYIITLFEDETLAPSFVKELIKAITDIYYESDQTLGYIEDVTYVDIHNADFKFKNLNYLTIFSDEQNKKLEDGEFRTREVSE